MAVAIALRHVQHFLLAGVALLALYVAVGGLGQHMRGAGEQLIARVDFVRVVAGNDEEGDAVTHLRGPLGLLVEARLDGGLGGVIPQQAVAFVGHQKGHAEAGSGGSKVVGPAAHHVAAMIEEAFVVLAQAVVMLVGGRGEGRAHGVEPGVGGAAVVEHLGGAVLLVGLALHPAGHLQQRFAIGGAQRDVRAGSRAAEVLAEGGLIWIGRPGAGLVAVHSGDDAR